MIVFILLVWIVVLLLIFKFDHFIVRKKGQEKAEIFLIFLYGPYFSTLSEWIRTTFLSGIENRFYSLIVGFIFALAFIISIKLLYLLINKRLMKYTKVKDEKKLD